MLPPFRLDYYGKASTEAILEFESSADIGFTQKANLSDLHKNVRMRTLALEKLDAQIQHLMGTFQSQSFLDEFGYPGVLGESYSIEFTEFSKINSKRALVKYKFKGKVVFHTEAFQDKLSIKVPIKLPLAADKIYALGLKGDLNKCSDVHYNSEEDFWYFWDPDMHGCPLKGDNDNVLRIYGRLKKLLNTSSTYPEYDQLYGDNHNGSIMKTSLFLGYIDAVESLSIPNRKDDGYIAFKEIEKSLEDLGYELKEKKDAFRENTIGSIIKGINFFRFYEKKVQTKLGKVILSQVELMLSDTDINSLDETFQRHYVKALEDSDLIAYDGHSGLGSTLNLDMLPDFSFKPKKYQIIYFNGCSSYPYYNGHYFSAKGGTKFMDLITSGLPTLTNTSMPNMMAFATPFLEGTLQSYQRLLNQIEFSNGDNGTYLVGVNGDEDNKFKP
jgi:hypothetical protein